MPKDTRPFITFTVEFPDHPKIAILSDAAFRCLHEAISHSRQLNTNGLLRRRFALKRWGAEVLAELCANDDENPSLVESDKGWMIHDYEEHQVTTCQVDDLSVKRKTAGQRGGLASGEARRRSKTEANGSKAQANPEQKEADIEEEIEVGGPLSTHRYVSNAPARTEPADEASWLVATSDRNSELSPPVTVGASRLIAMIIRNGIVSDATRTILRIKTSEGLKNGRSEDDMAECLRIWLTKPTLGPNGLLSCLDEVDKRKLNITRLATSDLRVLQGEELKRKFRSRKNGEQS